MWVYPCVRWMWVYATKAVKTSHVVLRCFFGGVSTQTHQRSTGRTVVNECADGGVHACGGCRPTQQACQNFLTSTKRKDRQAQNCVPTPYQFTAMGNRQFCMVAQGLLMLTLMPAGQGICTRAAGPPVVASTGACIQQNISWANAPLAIARATRRRVAAISKAINVRGNELVE